MPEQYTQADLDAAVASATDPLRQRLAELEAEVTETEVGKAVAAATADRDTQIADLQHQLDTATAARSAAETKLTETDQYWTAAVAAAQEAVAIAARRDERTAKAAELGVFSDEYLASNAQRFAVMSDEDFAARLDEWRLIAAQAKPGADRTDIPATTAFMAHRTEEQPASSALGRLTEMRMKRIDPRALGGTR
jgi:hypothetical protein